MSDAFTSKQIQSGFRVDGPARAAPFAPFELRGVVDMLTPGDLGAALIAYAETSEGDVVCECGDLEFLDSAGIAVLIRVQRELEEIGRRLQLVNVPDLTYVALEVCGLLGTFGIA